VTESGAQIVRGVAFLVALVAAIALQRLSPYARFRGSVSVNAGLWLVNAVVLGSICGACICAVADTAAQRGVGVLNVLAAPTWMGVSLTIVALDLLSYGWHRANHRIPLLWRFHRVHHSDETFTVSTGLRFHPGELLLSLPLRIGAVLLLGAPWQGVLAFEFVFTVSNLLEHGDIALPAGLERRLAAMLVTPALHRRHHSSVGMELDRNFGTVFTFWDQALGTYRYDSSSSRIEPGLPDGVRAPTLAAALMLPFAARR
jgi:sterol desaturase/sphingolipid hydroxylase (fatty acid hydroxylase superfamily)